MSTPIRGGAGSRRGDVPAFEVMRVLAEANALEAQGRDIIHLEAGQPAGGAPATVMAAGRVALEQATLGYTESLGVPALRARIAEHYRLRYGVAVDPARIVVTTGSSGGFLLAFLAAFDAGARVGVVEPGYPAYRNMLGALDLKPVGIPVDARSGFNPTLGDVAATGRLDGLILASPANPTGAVLDDAALAAHAAAARAGGTRLIVDEIYHGIVYGTPAQTILAHAPDAIVVSGFSKYYGMTGWRLGWMVVPEGLIGAVERLAQNFFISAPTLAQLAGVAAFDATAELDARVAEYARNRALLIEGLPKAGFRDVHAPAGAFYLYSGLPEGVTESRAFCHDLLHRTGVALAPGIDFDPLRGHGTVRFSFAGAHDRIAEALRRLGAG